MSVAIKIDPERRQQSKRLVNELQETRHEVWALYCQIAELKPFTGNTDIKLMLKKFAEVMVDYVSLGHFGIYERLTTGKERRENVFTRANELYPEFSETTDAVVSFNDQYDDTKPKFRADDLEPSLSSLGENLAKRMEIEDELCSLLLH